MCQCIVFVIIIWYIISETSAIFEPKRRIINGIEVPAEQFGYQVQILSPVGFCAGSIIGKDVVLSSAHCFVDINNEKVHKWQIQLKVGSVEFNQGKVYHVSHFEVHRKYYRTSINFENDIALLFIDGEFDLIASRVIKLTSKEPAEGTICSVSGWGYTKPEGVASQKLLYTNVTINNLLKCKQKYQWKAYISEKMLCAGENDPGDSCHGDSGGALVCHDVLVGVVSFGYVCGMPNMPHVYTNVYKFLNWITTNRAEVPTYLSNLLLGTTIFHLLRHLRES